MNDTQQAFFYVDGIPTKGKWIDLEDVTDTDDVLRELADAVGDRMSDISAEYRAMPYAARRKMVLEICQEYA